MDIVKCGNCAYEGEGRPGRSTWAKVLAIICVVITPIITIVYFLATKKYFCPKCGSAFLGIRNPAGVYVSQSSATTVLVVVLCAIIGISVMGLLSTLAVVALGSARVKARDARRLSDMQQLQTALEMYYNDNKTYPVAKEVSLGSPQAACLSTKGWDTADCETPYMSIVPKDPKAPNMYVYTGEKERYTVEAALEGNLSGYTAGAIELSPMGIKQ